MFFFQLVTETVVANLQMVYSMGSGVTVYGVVWTGIETCHCF